jgi:hypothetical protein
VVDDVEAHERREQPPVGQRDAVAGQVAALAQQRLEPRQCLEDAVERLVVRLLRAREAGAVDAVLGRR